MNPVTRSTRPCCPQEPTLSEYRRNPVPPINGSRSTTPDTIMITNEMILASAGSGKTYQLTNRYTGLLALQLKSGGEEAIAPERIIAVTFTRKAAGEFFDSILEKLALAASKPEEIEKLARSDAPLAGILGATSQDDFRRILRVFVSRMPRLFLGTLDSFFSNIVRSFPAEFGLAGDFEILDEHLAGLAKREVYRSVFSAGLAGAGNDQEGQREFLEAFRLATIGKEEARIRRELDDYVGNLHAVFLRTPSPAKWGQADAIWGKEGSPFLPDERQTGLKNAFRRLFAAIEDLCGPPQWQFWEEFREESLAHVEGTPFTRRIVFFLERLLPAWAEVEAGEVTLTVNRKKQTLGPPACDALRLIVRHLVGGEIRIRLARTRGVRQLLDRYEEVYAKRIRRQGSLTFADLSFLLAGTDAGAGGGSPVLSQRPGEEERLRIDYRLDGRYDHWLLDEFQDTSRIQWAALRNLVDETVQDTSDERSLFYVGDIKQAIYGWRGGDPRLFHEIATRYNAGGEERITRRFLDISWRSGPDVIDAVNRVFGDRGALESLPLPGSALARWEWNDHSPSPKKEKLTGYCAFLNPVKPEKGRLENADRFALVAALLEQIDPVRRGIECAVLVQRNDLGTELVDYLRATTGIPVTNEADVAVATDNALNRAALSYLACAAHPSDTLAWEHLRLTPFRDVIEREDWTPGRLSAAVRTQLFEHDFEWVVRRFVAGMVSAPGWEFDPFTRKRAEDLALAARRFDQTGGRDIDAFLLFARDYTVREPGAANAVQVMTIHKSKGLTFDAVILPDLEGTALDTAREGIGIGEGKTGDIAWVSDLPVKMIREADPVLRRHLEAQESDAAYESLCKFYVAMTRAKHANYLIANPRGSRSTSANFVKLLEETLGTGEPREHSIGEREAVLRFESDLSTTDREWYAAHRRAEAEPPSPPRPVMTNPHRARPRVGRRTPSGSEEALVSAAQLFSPEGRRARELGTLVHRLFEDVTWLDETTTAALEKAWEPVAASHPAIRDEALSLVRGCLEVDAVRHALSRPAPHASCWRERSFEILLDGEWLSGTFDRVAITGDASGKPVEATILDYKTDRVETAEDVEKAITVYRPQLDTYGEVLSRMTGLPRSLIRRQLLFVRANRIVTL